jgi:hypothetical protein
MCSTSEEDDGIFLTMLTVELSMSILHEPVFWSTFPQGKKGQKELFRGKVNCRHRSLEENGMESKNGDG